MGFPYEEASWDVVDGAMYIGAGTGSTAMFTLLAVVVCIYALWSGNRKEHKLYDDYQ